MGECKCMYTHQAFLHRFLTRTSREYRIHHEEEPPTPLKDGTGHGRGSLCMDIATDHGALFSDEAKNNSLSVTSDVAVPNPSSPSILAPAGTRVGFALEEAVKVKDTQYSGYTPPCLKIHFLGLLHVRRLLVKRLVSRQRSGQIRSGNGGGLSAGLRPSQT